MTNGRAVPRCLIASGQRGCWDESGAPIPCSGSGQDGEFRPGIPWPEPRFTIAGELARDRLTGMTWTIDANLFEWPLTWSEALDHVAGLRLNHHLGHDDWRLPTRRELWSLVSFAQRNPALPEGHPFRGVFLGWYWTSTSAARNPAYAWAVQTSGGRVFFEAKDRRAFAWACRGTSPVLPATGQSSAFDAAGRPAAAEGSGQDLGAHSVAWPDPRFEVHDESVTDRLTGLIWTRSADLSRGVVSWTEALALVEALNDGRASPANWRLPGITELESLLDARCCDPSLPARHPFVHPGAGYWSSTTSSYETDWAMVLHLGRGAIGVGVKRDPRYLVWPVRGPSDSSRAPV